MAGHWRRRRYCTRLRNSLGQSRACIGRDDGTTGTGWPHNTGKAGSNGVLECSQHGELSRDLTKRIATGHGTTKSTIQRGQSAKSAL